MTPPNNIPLAIIGLGCRLPGADSAMRFMHQSLEGTRALTRAPAGWGSELGLRHPLVGGFVSEEGTDWKQFRLPPLQLERMHRMERLLHLALVQATQDAGYSPEKSPGHRCAIYLGASGLGVDVKVDQGLRVRTPELREHLSALLKERTDGARLLEAVDQLVDEQAPPIITESVPTTATMVAGRLAGLLDTRGGHLAIDAGTASSLAALKFASQSLQQGHCDVAVVGAVAPLLSASSYGLLAARGWLAEQELLALDSHSSGTLPGEGAVAIVLCRLDDALADEQRIYAVLHDVSSEVNLKQGLSRMSRVVDRAARTCLERAGVEPEQVRHVELQACGIPGLEDQEYLGLKSSLAGMRSEPLTLSSAAPQVGFQQAASGLVSVMRAALSLHGGMRAPTAGLSALRHPATDSTLECLTRPTKLPPRSYVGVSSLGWTGAAYHALLGPAPTRESRVRVQPVYPPTQKVAIIGMGAIAPGAPDARALWTNVISKADAIGDLPTSRFDANRVLGALMSDKEVVPRLAGVVDLPAFDPRWLKLPPAQASALDPAVVLFVKAAEEAMQQAGYQPGAWNGRRVQVVAGQLPVRAKEFETELRFVCERYLALAEKALRASGLSPAQVSPLLEGVRQRVQALLPPLDDNTSQYYTGLTCAARLASIHDFTGGVMAVDAACASSLASLHAGVLALAHREADVVVAGGVAFNLVPEYFASLSVLGILSPRGTFPFDDRADGFVPAEGAGAVVLKRLEDAEAAKDRIIAVVSGVGFSSDGRGTTLFTPNPKGQGRAVERALQDAQVHPDQVGLLEAHGTGTRVGDIAEATAYGEAFHSRGRDNPVPFGTLKSQIGHTSSASGMLGLIKASFAVSEAFLPPMNGGEFPRSEIPFDRLPISLSLEGRPWPAPREGRRRAGVSSFGIGGSNYHVILEEHDNTHRRMRTTDPLPTMGSYPIPSRGLSAQRWSVDMVPLSLSPEKRYPLNGKKLLLISEDPGLEAAFTRLLVSKGVRLITLSVAGLTDALEVERRVRRASEEMGGIDGVIDLAAFKPAEYFLTQGSARFARRMAETTARWHGTGRALYERLGDSNRTTCYVAVTAMGGDFGFVGDGGNVLGGAVAGFLKGLKQELPGALIKVVDFEPRLSHWVVAESVARELEEGSNRTEVGYMAGRRFVVGLRRSDFHENSPVLRQLDPNWVLVFSGGGRGAVFEVAKAVARLGPGPKVIVTGRTPAPHGDEPYLALDDEDFEAFRREEMLRRKKEDPGLTPVKFNQDFDRFVRARELWRNLQEIYSLGLPIEYETCDICNPADVREMMERVREYHGHIDGIVHGAMVEASKSLPDKTPGLVASTLDVKVMGLVNLLEATRRDDLKLVMCFGSGAGRFGNKGQTDYSAANDLMSKCLMAYAHRARSNMRCVTIDWTAWEGAGAAVRNREVVQNTGVSFITPAEGSYWFINELLLGRSEREVAIFEERLFREWPFLGASAEGPGARTVYDDRGFLLVPSDYPMVDGVERHDAEGLVATRSFDLTTDPFVLQHQLHSVPIMPGTFGFEMLGEAAALFRPDLTILRAESLRIDTPLKFFKAPLIGDQAKGKPIHVTLTVRVLREQDDEVTLYVESCSDLALGRSDQTQRRIHHQGFYVLGPAPKEEPGRGRLPDALPGSRARSIFHLAKEPLYLGPLFCRAEWVYVGEKEVEGIIRAPRQREIFTHVARPRFQLDPLLLDAAFQVAANWDGHHNNLVSVPMGVDRLVRGRQRRLGESGHVKARMTKVDGDDVLYDFEVRGEDGALLLGGSGLWFRRLRAKG